MLMPRWGQLMNSRLCYVESVQYCVLVTCMKIKHQCMQLIAATILVIPQWPGRQSYNSATMQVSRTWLVNTIQEHFYNNWACVKLYRLCSFGLWISLGLSSSCCTDGTVMLTSSLLWAGWSSLDSVLLTVQSSYHATTLESSVESDFLPN